MGQHAKKDARVPPPRPDRRAGDRKQELAAARHRVTVTKVGVLAAVGVLFVGGMNLARAAYAGHAKAPIVPLAAPGRYERIVKKNLLQAGVVAPAQAPPGAASAPS